MSGVCYSPDHFWHVVVNTSNEIEIGDTILLPGNDPDDQENGRREVSVKEYLKKWLNAMESNEMKETFFGSMYHGANDVLARLSGWKS